MTLSRTQFLALPLPDQWRIANAAGAPTLEAYITRHLSETGTPDLVALRAKVLAERDIFAGPDKLPVKQRDLNVLRDLVAKEPDQDR